MRGRGFRSSCCGYGCMSQMWPTLHARPARKCLPCSCRPRAPQFDLLPGNQYKQVCTVRQLRTLLGTQGCSAGLAAMQLLQWNPPAPRLAIPVSGRPHDIPL